MQERINNCVLQIIAESAGTRGEGAYLVDVSVKGKGSGRKIEVLLDADTGIRIQQCAWFSRRLREKIEGDDDLLERVGENFDVMVSSPGLGEPIRLRRQYIRHTGKLLSVKYTDQGGAESELRGHLQAVSLSEDGRSWIIIMPEKSRKKGTQTALEGITLYLAQVICAVPEAEL